MRKSSAVAIVAGGLIAGTVDLMQAFYLFGHRVPFSIAAGLLGRQAGRGGAGTYLLGVLLHYFIATTFTACYYASSRRVKSLTENPLVCGLVYGACVELVMSYAVLPLSALHATGPFTLHDVLQGILVHMVTVGVPIAYSVRLLGNPASGRIEEHEARCVSRSASGQLQ